MPHKFHFMPDEIHFMPEPTLLQATTESCSLPLLNECSFSIISPANPWLSFLIKVK